MNGWIKLHRKLLESLIFDNPRALKVWVWCLLRANHKPAKVMVGHQVVHLEAGEFITGSHKASKELGIPVATLWRYLETLEELKMVERKSENKYTVLKVVNWGVYQGEENGNGKQTETKRKTNGNQTETNNNDKKNKEYPEPEKLPRNGPNLTYPASFEEFWTAYPRSASKKLSYKRWRAWVLNRKANPADLLTAAQNFARYCDKEGRTTRYIPHASTWLSPSEGDWEQFVEWEPETESEYADLTHLLREE